MQLAQGAGLDDEERARHGRGDGKLGLRHRAHGATGENVGALSEQLVAVGEGRRVQRAWRRLLCNRRRHRARRDIDLLLGKVGEGRLRQIEGLGQHLWRRVAEPIADAERAELREIAVVEHQHEHARPGADPLDGMAVAAREVPDVARTEIDDLALVLRVDGGDAAAPFDHIGPFGSVGVPVQLAQSPGLECHVDAGELLRHRELDHCRLLRRAAVEGVGRQAAEREAEGRELRSVERWGRRSEGRLHRSVARRCGTREKTTHGHSSDETASGQSGHCFISQVSRVGKVSRKDAVLVCAELLRKLCRAPNCPSLAHRADWTIWRSSTAL